MAQSDIWIPKCTDLGYFPKFYNFLVASLTNLIEIRMLRLISILDN